MSIRYFSILLVTSASLSGCQWIGDRADDLGDHLPVIGERCEHWQCFTESGRAQSRARTAYRNAKDAPPAAGKQPSPSVAPQSMPQAPATPEEPEDSYPSQP